VNEWRHASKFWTKIVRDRFHHGVDIVQSARKLKRQNMSVGRKKTFAEFTFKAVDNRQNYNHRSDTNRNASDR